MGLTLNPITGKFDVVEKDHTKLSNIGTNTHAQIDSHIADGSLHFTEGSIDHGSIAGLGDDDHSQYALLAGRSGGQTLIGGTGAFESLTLQSTSDANKRYIIFGAAGTTVYNEATDSLSIGGGASSVELYIKKTGTDPSIQIEADSVSKKIEIFQYRTTATGTTLGVTKANLSSFMGYDNVVLGTFGANTITLGTDSAAALTIDSTQQVGIGVTAPGAKLHSIATTEQLRLGYDASNYAGFTVNSSGNLSILPILGTTLGYAGAATVSTDASGLEFHDTDAQFHTDANSSRMQLGGGSTTSISSGAYINLFGNTYSGGTGGASINLGNVAGAVFAITRQGSNQVAINSSGQLILTPANGKTGIGETSPDYALDVNGSFGFTPGTSVTPVDNGDVVIEATNNTTLTFKLKGSDGVVRSGTLTLA